MSLLYVLIVMIIVGVVLYMINRFVPLEGNIKTILNWVVIIFLIIWILQAVGAFSYLSTIRI